MRRWDRHAAAVLAVTIAGLLPVVGGPADAGPSTPRPAQLTQPTVELVDLTPESWTVLIPETATLDVAVTGPDGAPVEGQEVVVENTDTGSAGTSYDGGLAPGEVGRCTTDAEGRCQIELPPDSATQPGKDRLRARLAEALFLSQLQLLQSEEGPSDVGTLTWVTEEDEGDTHRLGGKDRFETAVAISRELYPVPGSAGAVVIVRHDRFPDALVGTPFAASVDAPILLTPTEFLHEATERELLRVLPQGRTVYILGGEQAVGPAVAQRIAQIGYEVQRIGGPTRVETAIAVARAMGDPGTLIITAGHRWPDAVVAGAAAAARGGTAILLSGRTDTQKHEALEAYLAERLDADDPPTVYAVGGPAVNPYATDPRVDQPIYGPDRFATGVAVAEIFFGEITDAAIARSGLSGGEDDTYFVDSLTGGVHAGGRLGAPVLLQPTLLAPPFTHATSDRYLCHHADTLTDVWLYGGTAALSEGTEEDVGQRARGQGCLRYDDEPTWVPHTE